MSGNPRFLLAFRIILILVIVVAWAPNEPAALDVIYEMTGRGPRESASFFHHDAMRDRYAGATITPGMPRGDHFLNPDYPWNL